MLGWVGCGDAGCVLEDELARLRSFPELGRAELIRHFTLAGADEAQCFGHACGVVVVHDGAPPGEREISAAADRPGRAVVVRRQEVCPSPICEPA